MLVSSSDSLAGYPALGQPFDSLETATLEALGSSWSRGGWNGSTWSGSTWSGASWLGATWG